MNSLRARVAFILVASIISVVGIATAATVFVTQGLKEENLGAHVAQEVMLIAPLFRTAEQGSMPRLDDAPAAGRRLDHLTNLLQARLRQAGSDFEVVVTQLPTATYPIASVKLGTGWLAIPMPGYGPPPGSLIALVGWMCLIAIGTCGVALFIAHRITRHLALLESIALTVGADGVLPLLPERGPAEIRATARALNTMSRRLKAAIESRMRLVAAAGHDLRTPLTRMRLRAEFLQVDERLAWLADLEELDRIADSAIQLVRGEVEEKKNEQILVDDMATEICRELASMNLPVRIRSVERVTVSSSPLALKRALRNLIINAATHGGGAYVTVAARANVATIVIEDNGPGIPEEMMSRAFEPFFRVDPSRRHSVPGAGLGLAIAKELIEQQGGKLTLQNRTPNGLQQEVLFMAT